jgi:hypothetical protein
VGRFGPDVAESRYLPQDPDPDRPTVAAQLDDEGSLLHLVRRLAHLRTDDPRLDAAADVEVLATGYPFAYVRGGSLAVVLNPGRAAVSITVPGAAAARTVEARGHRVDGDVVHLDGHGYAVLDLA